MKQRVREDIIQGFEDGVPISRIAEITGESILDIEELIRDAFNLRTKLLITAGALD